MAKMLYELADHPPIQYTLHIFVFSAASFRLESINQMYLNMLFVMFAKQPEALTDMWE